MLQTILRYALIILFFSTLPGCSDKTPEDFRAATFAKLNQIKTHRMGVIVSYLDGLREKATGAAEDPVFVEFFEQFYLKQPNEQGNSTGFLTRSDALDRHYVDRYSEFYDVLFVNNSGKIFNSIKMEWDYGKSIFGEQLAGTKLARALRADPDVGFVDFDFYSPSEESASFFVTRVPSANGPLGWLVFQFSVNTINSVLADFEDLGVTGEVYLTNREKLMMTQSRLVPADTTLNLSVNTVSLTQALDRGEISGDMVIDDYRGVRVFSSFEKFEFESVTWVIVAEIDEEEVVTNHYRANKDFFLPRIVGKLGKGATKTPPRRLKEAEKTRVDINEFARGGAESTLVTYGVATCTAVIVTYPQKFGYLGHINPLDASYHSGFSKFLLDIREAIVGKDRLDAGDLLGRMLAKIRYYDIPPHEIQKIRVNVVAIHTDSFEKVIDKLLDAGLFLSQIQLVYGPDERYANILNDVGAGTIFVEWVGADAVSSNWTTTEKTPNLGSVVQQISGYTPK